GPDLEAAVGHGQADAAPLPRRRGAPPPGRRRGQARRAGRRPAGSPGRGERPGERAAAVLLRPPGACPGGAVRRRGGGRAAEERPPGRLSRGVTRVTMALTCEERKPLLRRRSRDAGTPYHGLGRSPRLGS